MSDVTYQEKWLHIIELFWRALGKLKLLISFNCILKDLKKPFWLPLLLLHDTTSPTISCCCVGNSEKSSLNVTHEKNDFHL